MIDDRHGVDSHPDRPNTLRSMHDGALIPFFQGNLDQIRELQELCQHQGVSTTPMEPPDGGGG